MTCFALCRLRTVVCVITVARGGSSFLGMADENLENLRSTERHSLCLVGLSSGSGRLPGKLC